MEFTIADDVPTDVDPKPSAIIQLGEEALQWQKMYSDSEGESDYNPDGEDVGGRHLEYQSNSSASDSDEDFTCSFTTTVKKKRGPKPGTKYGERASSGRGGISRRGRGGGRTGEPKDVPLLVRPPEDVHSYITNLQPPPLLVKQEDVAMEQASPYKIQKTTRVPPALIKTENISNQSTYDINEEFDRLTNVGVSSSHISSKPHIQPPPSLVMPTPQLREPPPLVKKEEEPSRYPHIMLPSASDQGVVPQRTLLPKEGVMQSTPPPPPPAAPAPRRPGRPRKDQSNTSHGGLKTSSKTVRLGSSKTNYKPSKSLKGQSTSYSAKGMKMTQYEFQSVSMATSQQQQQQQQHVVNPSSNTPVQVSNLQNVVTPLQIIPAGSLHYPNIGGVPSGSVLYVQGAPQGVALAAPQGNDMSSTYITQDGNTYQLVQASPAQLGADDNAQKVSVIMHPGTAGGIQYITQLDGPPPKVKSATTSPAKDDLRKRFEEARNTERAKLEDVTVEEREAEKMETGRCGSSRSRESSVDKSVQEGLSGLSIGTRPSTVSHSQSSSGMKHRNTEIRRNTSPEEMMSVQLKSYFKMEKARKAKCLSPPMSERSRDASGTLSAPGLDASSQRRKRRSSSSRSTSRGASSSPTRNVKSPKSPRLVVSPTLFSPSTSSSTKPGTRMEPSGAVTMATSAEPASVKSTSKKKKQLPKNVAPNLPTLFLPDNISATTSSHQKAPPHGSKKQSTSLSSPVVEFSTSLPDSVTQPSSLQRPTPLDHHQQSALKHNSNHSNSHDTTTAAVSSSDSDSSSSSASSLQATPTKQLEATPTKRFEDTPMQKSEELEVHPSCLKLGKHSLTTSSDHDDTSTPQPSGSGRTPQVDDSEGPSTGSTRKIRRRDSSPSNEHTPSGSAPDDTPPSQPGGKRRRGRPSKAAVSSSRTPQRTKGKQKAENETSSSKNEDPSTGEAEAMDTSESMTTPRGGRGRKRTRGTRGRPPSRVPLSGERTILNCSHCDKTYTTQAGLTIHLNTAHAGGLTVSYCKGGLVEVPLGFLWCCIRGGTIHVCLC